MDLQSLSEQVFWGNTVKSYAIFFFIIFLGLLFKRIISKLFSRLLYKLFARFAEGEGHNEAFVALLVKPIELFILFTTIYMGLNRLKHPLDVVLYHYSKVIDKVKVSLPVTIGDALDKVFLFLIILSVFQIFLKIVDFVAIVMAYKAKKTKNKADDQLVPFLRELFKTFIVFIAFFTLLGFVFEVNVLTLITGLGIGGIAIALAAKESLENLIGSFTIFLDRPFTVGDIVKVNGIEGTVEKVGFRSTWIRTADKTMITIPNRGMINGVLENMAMRNTRRVKFAIGLTYETSSENIQQIIQAIKAHLNADPKRTRDAQVYFDSFGDSALNLEVVYYIPSIDYSFFLEVKESVNFKVMEIVAQYGSDFAYPTQRLVSNTVPLNKEEEEQPRKDPI